MRTSAGGTLPAPILSTDDLYIIRVDANTVKLATSSANALAGTAIDLTTAGSGTLELVYKLPWRRPRIAAPGAQVFSPDANQVWESIQALQQLLSAQSQNVFGAVQLAGALSVGGALTVTGEIKHGTKKLAVDIAAGILSSGTGSYDGTKWTATATPFEVDFSLPLHEGDRITAVTVFYSRDSGSTLTFTLKQRNTDGTGPTTLCQKNVSSGTGAGNTEIGTSPSSGSLPQTLAANKTYLLRCSLNNTDDVYAVIVTYDRP